MFVAKNVITITRLLTSNTMFTVVINSRTVDVLINNILLELGKQIPKLSMAQVQLTIVTVWCGDDVIVVVVLVVSIIVFHSAATNKFNMMNLMLYITIYVHASGSKHS